MTLVGDLVPGDNGGGIGNLKDFKVISVDTSLSPQSVVISSADIAIDFIFFVIKDETNNASVNNITIGTEGAEKIDVTLDTVVVNANSGGLLLYSHNGNLFSW